MPTLFCLAAFYYSADVCQTYSVHEKYLCGVCHTNLCISSRRCCMVRIDAQFRKSSPGTWLSVHCSGSTYISFIQIYRSKGTQQSTWILGASAAAGGSAGVFLGGAITEWLSWHWIFLINIPVGLIVLMRSRSLLFTGDTRKGKVDMAGAILATAALILMVYAIVSSESEGWGSVHTIGLLVLSLALLFAFMYFKTKSEPLMPLSILKYPIFQLVISLWLYWRQHGYHSGFSSICIYSKPYITPPLTVDWLYYP